MYNPNYDFHLTGWECPKCHRIYSPSTPVCLYCNDTRVVWAEKTNTNDSEWWKEYLKGSTTGGSDVIIKPDGSYIWTGQPLETYLYKDNNTSWRDWLDAQTNMWDD